MSIKIGSTKIGNAIVDGKMSVNGGIKMGGGGSAPVVVEARWGQIEGNIQSQTDLMDSLAAKQDIVSGEDGQFLGFVNGALQAVSLPIYNGGVS